MLSASLPLSGPSCCSVAARPDDICPEERPADIERSGVVAVVDTASRPATASVAGVQHAVSTHPVSASGIRLSSRPVSDHLGSSSRVRRSAAWCPPVRCPAVCCPPVRCPAVWCLPPSIRTRPSPPTSGGGVGNPGRAGRATVTAGTGGGPFGCRAVDGSIDGPGGRDAGDATEVALVSGRSVADPGRRVGAGPVAGGCAVGAGAGCSARSLQPPPACRPRAGARPRCVGRRRA